MHLRQVLTLSLLGLIGSSAAFAQTSPSSNTPINAAEQNAVIAALGQQLKSRYVFPDVAAKTAAALSARAAHGNYRDDKTEAAFAKALSSDLVAIGNDKHLAVKFAPDLPPPSQHDDKSADDKKSGGQGTDRQGNRANDRADAHRFGPRELWHQPRAVAAW